VTTKRPKPKKQDTVFVAVKIPRELAAEIDRLVASQDTDKSKFFRSAVREKIARTQQPA
jgi:metal-responsive CopG/Arc/MetJ family transcriptional regulator